MATLTVGLGGTYSTIQAAVDAAGNGDTIEIAAGTYREQVTVDGKNITIHGAGSGQTIIEAPDAASLVSNASDSNAARQTKYAVVTVKGDADVTIAGVTVDGRDQASIPNPPTELRLSGYLRAQFRCPYRRRRSRPVPTNWPAPTSPASSATTRSWPPVTTPPMAAPALTRSRSRTRPSAVSRRPAFSSTDRR